MVISKEFSGGPLFARAFSYGLCPTLWGAGASVNFLKSELQKKKVPLELQSIQECRVLSEQAC